MKEFLAIIRTYLLRGLLASIPIFLSYHAVKFIYSILVNSRMTYLAEDLLGYRNPGLNVIFGMFLVIIVLFLLGVMASNVLGQKLLSLIENVSKTIPILSTVYEVGKQVSMALSLPSQQAFRRVVLVQAFRPEAWVIGFVTGEIRENRSSKKLLKIFVPTVPNPTSGFLVHVEEAETIDPGWSVEEAMRIVISGGIIGPDVIGPGLPSGEGGSAS